jgi:hypothetical protein
MRRIWMADIDRLASNDPLGLIPPQRQIHRTDGAVRLNRMMMVKGSKEEFVEADR